MKNEDKNIVQVETSKKVVVDKEKQDNDDVSKSLEQHMEENRKNVKTKIDIKVVGTYALMFIIVVVCLLLLVHFCENQYAKMEAAKNTTTNPGYVLLTTTEVTTGAYEYVRTTAPATKATHTVFPGNTSAVANTTTPDYDRNGGYVVHSTVTTTTTTTTTTSTTTTNNVEDTTTTTETTTTTSGTN